MEAGGGSQYLVRANNYLLVDIGGGRVDIASHAIVHGQIKQIAPPAANFWGGTTVNEEFSTFLQDFVDDPGFSRYTTENQEPDEQARHKADLNKLLYIEFEAQKMRFGSGDGGNSYIVQFPYSFVKQYKESLVEKELSSKGDESVQVEDDGAVMLIQGSKMTEFFQPALHGIAGLIESHLLENKIARTIDTIYWVGGFGGCEYLRNQLEAVIHKKFIGCKYYFPVPPDPELAVVLGATVLRCDPSTVMERKPGAGGFDLVAIHPQVFSSTPASAGELWSLQTQLLISIWYLAMATVEHTHYKLSLALAPVYSCTLKMISI